MTPRAVDARFLAYAMRYTDSRKVFYSMGGGLRQSMKYADMKRLPVVVPSQTEQLAIVSFLDRETAKIDAFIADQEELIGLLAERRAATISHAVTKGLDPTVPMKDSGVEWLGEIPAHWFSNKISRLFSARKGTAAAMLTKEYIGGFPGPFPVYSGQTDNAGVMGCIEDYEFNAGERGHLLVTTVGAKAMFIRHIFGKYSLSQNCMTIGALRNESSLRFYYYLFQVLFDFAKSGIPQHMQASFRMEDFYQYKVPTPLRDEQEAIARRLDQETAEFDAAIADAKEAIALSRERRAALISAAVTGKIDVREPGAVA
jgi:type I restriction enzyme S subunit